MYCIYVIYYTKYTTQMIVNNPKIMNLLHSEYSTNFKTENYVFIQRSIILNLIIYNNIVEKFNAKIIPLVFQYS